MSYCFGIDIGGTTVKCGLFTTEGELLEKWEIKTRTEENGKAILPDVAETILKKMEEKGIAKADVIGVGVGVPGPVDSQGVVHRCVNLGWGVVNVAEELGNLTGLKIKVGNDANVAALGEMWQGGAKGSKDVIMVTLGTGVGGGIIVDGKVVAGFNGAGGELGHITVNNDEIEACNCGQYGCLEQYTSATGIVRLAKRKLAKSTEETSIREIPNLTAKDVFDAAKAGDAAALEITEEFGAYLGQALVNLAATVDPAVFVIGGGVSKAGDILLETVRKYFYDHAFYGNQKTKITLATLGNDAGIYGAAKQVL